MKTKTIITDITKEDLSTLFATTYGSSWLSMAIPYGSYKGTELEDPKDYPADKLAKVLLAGKKVYVHDYYAEGVAYGKLQHEDEEDYMRYELTLEDIKNNLAEAIDNRQEEGLIRCYIEDWIKDDGINLDLPAAENIMQYIVFGELIYG